MSKKELFRAAVADTLELPGDIVAGLPRLVITGRESILLENHGGIVHYDEGRLVVSYAGGYLEVRGENLVLPLLRSDILAVEGNLLSLGFTSGRE